jgi:hypothetical protein
MKRFACKAILNKATSSNLGLDWATANRCLLKVTDEYMEAIGKRIPFPDIVLADLRIVPSAFFIPGCILTVNTVAGMRVHFGLRYSSFWKNNLPFPVNRSSVTVPLLWPRRIINLAIFAWLLWWIMDKFIL